MIESSPDLDFHWWWDVDREAVINAARTTARDRGILVVVGSGRFDGFDAAIGIARREFCRFGINSLRVQASDVPLGTARHYVLELMNALASQNSTPPSVQYSNIGLNRIIVDFKSLMSSLSSHAVCFSLEDIDRNRTPEPVIMSALEELTQGLGVSFIISGSTRTPWNRLFGSSATVVELSRFSREEVRGCMAALPGLSWSSADIDEWLGNEIFTGTVTRVAADVVYSKLKLVHQTA